MESRNGLLIDYEMCCGCHACEVACRTEKGLQEGQWGIVLEQIGPWKLADKKWQFDYVPVPTDFCDLCADRVAEGRLPKCVHHCLSLAMDFGPMDKLLEKAASKPKVVVFSR